MEAIDSVPSDPCPPTPDPCHPTPDPSLIDGLFAHLWMVRTFVKHSPEVEDFPELMQVVRAIFDASRAVETHREDPADYIRMVKKKRVKLRAAAEQFKKDAPLASDHTNFKMAVRSLDAALDALDRSLSNSAPEGFGADGTISSISYLNTDLNLTASNDLTALASAFEAGGVFPLNVTHGEDGKWYAAFETEKKYIEPETNIAVMLAVVESLPETLRSVWAGCSRREFNIGYDCGLQPWAFNQGLSAELLGRMAVAGASMRVTLYPEH